MHGDAADGEHAAVLGHEDDQPAKAAVFGVEPGHQLALRLGQVEGGPFAAGHGAGEIGPEGDERERIVEDVPVPHASRSAAWRWSTMFMDPATMTGTSTHRAMGIS